MKYSKFALAITIKDARFYLFCFYSIFACVIFLNFIALSPACASSVSSASPSIAVKTAYIKRSKWTKYISVLGEVRSNKRSVLSAPFTGIVVESFSRPSFIYSGTTAARIVKPGLYQKIIAAEASVEYARAKLKRAGLLFRYGVAAKKDMEKAELSLAVSVSTLRVLEAENGEGALISSFNGSVKYLVPNGTPVNTGTPVAVVSGRGMPYIKAYITPRQAYALEKFRKRTGAENRGIISGGKRGIYGSGSRGKGRNAYNNAGVIIIAHGLKAAGKIFLIGDNARHFGLVPVYAKPVIKGIGSYSYLMPGEWVKLRIAESIGTGFSVPEKGVIIYGGKETVFIVKHNKAIAVPVKVMDIKGGAAYIKGSVKGSLKTIAAKREPVIIYPVTRLVSGTVVRFVR